LPEPLRVPLSELKVNPGGYLESARRRRVLLTRRGKVVGELVPLDDRGVARSGRCSGWRAT
jgi:prevent-host-death family protein